MSRTATSTRAKGTTSVRLEPELTRRMEAVRDPERFPTQSDFIREAVRRLVREERRNRVRERMKALAQDPGQKELARPWLEAAEEDLAALLEKADQREK